MGKLIKLQLRNVFHNKLFYVCTGIMILLSPVVTFLFNNSLNIAYYDIQNNYLFI